MLSCRSDIQPSSACRTLCAASQCSLFSRTANAVTARCPCWGRGGGDPVAGPSLESITVEAGTAGRWTVAGPPYFPRHRLESWLLTLRLSILKGGRGFGFSCGRPRGTSPACSGFAPSAALAGPQRGVWGRTLASEAQYAWWGLGGLPVPHPPN